MTAQHLAVADNDGGPDFSPKRDPTRDHGHDQSPPDQERPRRPTRLFILVLGGRLGGETAKVTVLVEPHVDDVEATSDEGRAQRPVLVRAHLHE